jgi:hypothetical protein
MGAAKLVYKHRHGLADKTCIALQKLDLTQIHRGKVGFVFC